MLDRIDIHIKVPRVDFEKLSDNRRGEASAEIRGRVEKARAKQRKRFANLNNGVMTKAAMSQLQLFARAYHRILKLARTIADLAGEEGIKSTHLAEALQYRPKGMMV